MSGSTQQIVTLYEENNLTVEQVATAFEDEFDLVAIRAVLSQFSPKYRAQNLEEGTLDPKQESKIGFSEEDEKVALATIRTLAEYGEDEHTRGKMAIFIREDRQGRRDAVSKLGQGAGSNIFLLQQFISKGNEALKLTEKKALDIKVQKVA